MLSYYQTLKLSFLNQPDSICRTFGGRSHQSQQPPRQGVVPEVVDAHVQLEAIGGSLHLWRIAHYQNTCKEDGKIGRV